MHKKIPTALYRKYVEEVIPKLLKEYKLKNHHALPEIKKVIVNMGIREAKDDKNILEEAVSVMGYITGQQPAITRAKKSISNFTLREGMPIGCRVTLHGRLMYEFLEKSLKVAFPRIRDFNGMKKSFDRFGNLTIGIIDESIYPEVNMDKIKSIKGMGITIVTDKENKEMSVKLFELMGFPFVR